MFGTPGIDGSLSAWDYTNGWLYRKDGITSSTTFNVSNWTTCKGCSDGFTNNLDMTNPFPIGTFGGAPRFSGIGTDSLTVLGATKNLDGFMFRRAVVDPAYVCDPEIGSVPVTLAIFLDHDNDGIIDQIDLDDDNDGILDTLETDADNDGDGIKNSFDLDSDGDGCFDVIEAGFTDGDDDGVLGSSPVTVDTLGLVTSGTDGYTTPDDNDNSGGYDFLEYGTIAVLVNSPDSLSITEGSTAMFVAKGTAAGGSITCYPYSSSDYVYIDNAGLISGSEYRLTYNGSYRDGQLWNKNKIDLRSNFTISAKLYFGNKDTNGGDGMAFVLQSTGTGAYGSYGDNKGYAGGNITNALAIDFDTNVSGSSSIDYLYRAYIKNGSWTWNELPRVNVGNLEDGVYRDVSISWNVDTKTLSVSLNGVQITTYTKDLITEIFGVNAVTFGFTAGTYGSYNEQKVKDISVCGTYLEDYGSNVEFTWQVSTDSATTWADITSSDTIYSGTVSYTHLTLPTSDLV